MLNRQRVLLEMLSLAGRPVTKIELVKWAFVLQQETETAGGSAFYDFVPYHYGPYSFSLAREMESLAALGYVCESEKTWAVGNVREESAALSKVIRQDIGGVLRRFEAATIDKLMDYVYHNYPAFTVNSKRERLATRPVAEPAVYTAGYEGLQIDGFLNLLVQNGIQCLIDVRSNPIARRFGFHKSTLARLCGFLGIEYQHAPELGIVSALRRNLETAADYFNLFERYRDETLAAQDERIQIVSRAMQHKSSVLVCLEADPSFCHRTTLAGEVSRRTELSVIHLRPKK